MEQSLLPTLAIIGAGVSGFLTAKYALQSGFLPTIFEKRSEVGGLWSSTGFMWPSMRTNSSKFTNEFSDFHWPDSQATFPTPIDVQAFFASYVAKFDLTQYIKFNCQVTMMKQAEGSRWHIQWNDLKSGAKLEQSFDYLIVATGYFSVPNMDAFKGYMEDKSNAGLEFVHSAHYKNAKNFEGKKVVLLGCSFSSTQIAAEICQVSQSTVNVFRRPAWCLKKKLYHPTYQQELPIDCQLYSRAFVQAKAENENLTVGDKNRKKNNFISKLSIQNTVNEQLFIDPDSEEFPRFAITDEYLGCIEKGLIQTKKAGIKDIKDKKVWLDNGEVIEADAVIFGTGFKNELDFIDEAVLNELEYSEKDDIMPLNLFNCTFHPKFRTMAFVGVFKGLFFGVAELQAKYAIEFLQGKNKAEPEVIEEKLRSQVKIRGMANRPQFANGTYVEFCEKLAQEMGMMPNFEEIREKDKSLHEFLMFGPLLICSYFLKEGEEGKRKEAMDYLCKVKTILVG